MQSVKHEPHKVTLLSKNPVLHVHVFCINYRVVSHKHVFIKLRPVYPIVAQSVHSIPEVHPLQSEFKVQFEQPEI